MTDEAFYTSARWKKKRAKILRRDHYLCQNCKRYGRLTEASEVHHIRHLDEAPWLRFEDGNLVSLCHSCHMKQHPERAAKGGRAKY